MSRQTRTFPGGLPKRPAQHAPSPQPPLDLTPSLAKAPPPPNLTSGLVPNALSTHEELDILKVEHSRTFSSQTCALQDLQTQEKDLRSQFEVAVWEKAESDIMLGMSKERMGSLMDEVAKLRRTVHEMQQTSAVAQGAGAGSGLGGCDPGQVLWTVF
ncbi:hypothetical protein EV702DRAFT_1252442 [Suillus placidus]|uniref:Uncharacterized protein n=1 Tax=Suillus placidus TaxID=48579 RepID=A0A9P6ZL58_9AGAM|nr:hypothetical protein EV702DRAFT_1252442 [Suillus placidus]